MVTLKDILTKFNVKHSFPDHLTIADVGDLSFDKVNYDQELITFENTEDPDIFLRFDRDRRDVFLYQAKGKNVQVTRWMIKGWDLDEWHTTVPREQVGM